MAISIADGLFNVVVNIKNVMRRNARSTMAVKSTLGAIFLLLIFFFPVSCVFWFNSAMIVIFRLTRCCYSLL